MRSFFFQPVPLPQYKNLMGLTGGQIYNCYIQDMDLIPNYILSDAGDEGLLQALEI